MFKIKEDILNEYASLAIIQGVNIQKDQLLVINAPVEAYELVRACTKIAYKQGASQVIVNYSDDQKTRLDYENMTKEALACVPDWQIARKQYEVDNGVAYLHIIGEDPDLLNGIDADKIKEANLARMKALAKFRYYTMNNIGQWSILAYPNVAWAKKVFPDLNAQEAMDKLWEAILYTSRVEVGKTLTNWDKHNEEVKKHAQKLNELNFKELHFINELGTDLRVGLVKDHIWEGGNDIASNGAVFDPNIPTEEVFTMPDNKRINGTVVSTKPLAYAGKIIPEFKLTFEDGTVVKYEAKENEEVLKDILDIDDGARSLGEVALISYDSPISDSGILFYDTLFDENASCHLALGSCYPSNVKNGSKMSSEELKKAGGNDSMVHVDFMFGSRDLRVIGKGFDDSETVVFDKGNFVF